MENAIILITKKQHTVTTISSYPQTFTMECEDCEGVTDSIIMREALMYDNTQFIDSVPPKYELDVAYYEKIPSSPFWRVVVFNKVKIDD